MIIIRDIHTRKRIYSTSLYSNLVAEGDALIGFTRMTCQLPIGDVPQEAADLWHGHEIQATNETGVLWEGRVEQVGTSEKAYLITAIGHGPAFLSDVPLAAVFYDNSLERFEAIPRLVHSSTSTGTTTSEDSYTVSTNNGLDLNVRSGPGLSYSVINTVSNGTIVYATGDPKNADGYTWLPIRNAASTITGWVIKSALTYNGTTTSSTSTTTSGTSEDSYVMKKEKNLLIIGPKKNKAYVAGEALGYQTNIVVEHQSSVDTYANIKWIRFSYNVTSPANSNFAAVVQGLQASNETWVDIHAASMGTTGSTTLSFQNTTGWRAFRLLMRCTTAHTYTSEDMSHQLQFTGFEMGVWSGKTSIRAVLLHVLKKVGNGLFLEVNSKTSNIFLDEPYIAGPDKTGLQIIQDMAAALNKKHGSIWRIGVWEGRKMTITDEAPRTRWLVDTQHLGQETVVALSRHGYVQNDLSANYTHVRTRFTSPSDGMTYRSADQPTALKLPFKRVLELESKATNYTEANAEALAEAQRLSTAPSPAQFTVEGHIPRRGGIFPVSYVRTGDWLEINAIIPSRKVKPQDFRRGGIIGRYVYNEDEQKVTMEFLGARTNDRMRR